MKSLIAIVFIFGLFFACDDTEHRWQGALMQRVLQQGPSGTECVPATVKCDEYGRLLQCSNDGYYFIVIGRCGE